MPKLNTADVPSARDGFFRVLLGALLSLALALSMLTSLAPKAHAAKLSDGFQAGNIISDNNFYGGTQMTAAQIQAFLEARVPRCTLGDPGREKGGWYKGKQLAWGCLKDAIWDLDSRPANKYCQGLPGGKKLSSATVIARVSAACGINPKVLLIMLEKEQSLISDSWPLIRQYDFAMGYDCPDSGPNNSANCNSAAGGFTSQVYRAAWQLQVYRGNPLSYNYRSKQNNTILWHPNRSCGTSQVYIQNDATAALYIYTPYRPNAAALAAEWGTGDACSTYGNRNFYNFYKAWFGSPTDSSPSPEQIAAAQAAKAEAERKAKEAAAKAAAAKAEAERKAKEAAAKAAAEKKAKEAAAKAVAAKKAKEAAAKAAAEKKAKEAAAKAAAAKKAKEAAAAKAAAAKKAKEAAAKAAAAKAAAAKKAKEAAAKSAAAKKAKTDAAKAAAAKAAAAKKAKEAAAKAAAAKKAKEAAAKAAAAKKAKEAAAKAAAAKAAAEKAKQQAAIEKERLAAAEKAKAAAEKKAKSGEPFEGYKKLGGESALGKPVGSPKMVGKVYIQKMSKGLTVAWRDGKPAQVVQAVFVELLKAQPADTIGAPLSAATSLGTGSKQVFEKAELYASSKYGAFSVSGEILTALNKNGGVSKLGMPVGPQYRLPSGVVRQDFEYRSVEWKASTGAKVYVRRAVN